MYWVVWFHNRDYGQCCNLTEIDSTYNNKYIRIKRESQHDKNRAHCTKMCSHNRDMCLLQAWGQLHCNVIYYYYFKIFLLLLLLLLLAEFIVIYYYYYYFEVYYYYYYYYFTTRLRFCNLYLRN